MVNIVNAFMILFDLFNAYKHNKSIHFFFLNLADPKLLHSSVWLDF